MRGRERYCAATKGYKRAKVGAVSYMSRTCLRSLLLRDESRVEADTFLRERRLRFKKTYILKIRAGY